MKNAIYRFWTNEDGQDLVEYTLLLALVAIGSASLLHSAGASASSIWTTTSSTTSRAASVAAS